MHKSQFKTTTELRQTFRKLREAIGRSGLHLLGHSMDIEDSDLEPGVIAEIGREHLLATAKKLGGK